MEHNYNDLNQYDWSESYSSSYSPGLRTKTKPKKAATKPKTKKLNLDKTITELETIIANAKSLLQVVKRMKKQK
jgi:hypothetical protein